MIDALKAQWKGDRLMKKNSTVATRRKQIFKHTQLTIGMDLGDRLTYYCILDEAGEVMVEQKLPTSKHAIKQVFGAIPGSRVALETGAHSPWVSRQLTQLGHDVIVAHARNVRLIGESSRKDDRLDARMLARLARLDPRLLSPVQAVARKLSVLLHKLWVGGEVYEPLRNHGAGTSKVA
jgi:transposase